MFQHGEDKLIRLCSKVGVSLKKALEYDDLLSVGRDLPGGRLAPCHMPSHRRYASTNRVASSSPVRSTSSRATGYRRLAHAQFAISSRHP